METSDNALKPKRKSPRSLETAAGLIREMGAIYRRVKAGKLEAIEGVRRVTILKELRATVESVATENFEKEARALSARLDKLESGIGSIRRAA